MPKTAPPPLAGNGAASGLWQSRCPSVRSAVCVLAAAAAVAVAAIREGWWPPPALSTEWKPLRNPPWEAARWRGEEHAASSNFAQWYYVMVTDAVSRDTYSISLGGFRGHGLSVGSLTCVRYGHRVPSIPSASVTFAYPAMHANTPPASFHVDVSTGAGGPSVSLLAASDDSLVLKAALPPPNATLAIRGSAAAAGWSSLPPSLQRRWAWAELQLHRAYGVFGAGEAAARLADPPSETCGLANLPFAYDSLPVGEVCLSGGCGAITDADLALVGDAALRDHLHSLLTAPDAVVAIDGSPRWRAYVESTVSCGDFPSGGVRGAAHPEEYPWKWMWAVVPAAADGVAAASQLPPRGGRERGEVGLVMSHARLALPLVPKAVLRPVRALVGPEAASTWALEVDVDGVFAFLDLPALRVGAINVTAGPLSVVRAAPPGAGALHNATLTHGEWADVTDAHGTAALPQRQTLRFASALYAAVVTFSTAPEQYVRLPVRYQATDPVSDAHVHRVVSDFRATTGSAYIRVARVGRDAEGRGEGGGGASCLPVSEWDARASCASSPTERDAPHAQLPAGYTDLLFQGYAPHNALEFAYHASFAEAAEGQYPAAPAGEGDRDGSLL